MLKRKRHRHLSNKSDILKEKQFLLSIQEDLPFTYKKEINKIHPIFTLPEPKFGKNLEIDPDEWLKADFDSLSLSELSLSKSSSHSSESPPHSKPSSHSSPASEAAPLEQPSPKKGSVSPRNYYKQRLAEINRHSNPLPFMKQRMKQVDSSSGSADTPLNSEPQFAYPDWLEQSDSSSESSDSDSPEDCLLDPIIGREKEMSLITKFLSDYFSQNSAQNSLYIHGFTGLGKTVCTKKCIAQLSDTYKFKYIYLNVLTYKTYMHIYKVIFDQISNSSTKISRNSSYLYGLQEYFTTAKNKGNILLVLDEIDYLIDKRQQVLYNLYEWSSYPNSNLILISVSNNSNIYEKFQNKVASRMGVNSLRFDPYKTTELRAIFFEKFKNEADQFDEDSVTLICRKIAFISGDIRKLVNIVKRCLIKANGEKITVDFVNQSLISETTSNNYRLFEKLSEFEKIVIFIMIHEGNKDFKEIRLKTLLELIDSKYNEYDLPLNVVSLAVKNLLRKKVIEISHFEGGNWFDGMIRPNFLPIDFFSAVKSSEYLEGRINKL